MLPDTSITTLPDGRELAWIELGPDDGFPVFAFHGTPGSRLQLSVEPAAAAEAGVRLIVPDRPGYGLSSYHHGRRLVDWPADVAHLADRLGLARFSVAGVSGGGPHAAVCACLLPDRVHAAAIVSGVAPIGEPGTEDAMMAPNQIFTRLARRSASYVLPIFSAMSVVGRHWPDRAVDFLSQSVPPADAAVLARPAVRDAFVADMARASRSTGRAAAQDFKLFTRDWGFRLEDIRVPVHVWQGDADQNVPPAHARLQAERIPGARLHECAGEAHLLVVDHLAEILLTVRGA